VADRQKTLAAHGAPVSDARLPVAVLDSNTVIRLDGRILVHGQEEQTGRNYLMLEGTDAKIHLVQYTPEMDRLRANGRLRINSFLRLRRFATSGRPILHVADLGDSEKVLKDRTLLREHVSASLKKGIAPTEDGRGGWLGRYQAAVAQIGRTITENRSPQSSRSRELQRGFSWGR
jgi:hypothetical protein